MKKWPKPKSKPSHQQLQLLIKYKQQEIKLAKLQLELEQLKHHQHTCCHKSDHVIILRNFGQENCAPLNLTTIEQLLDNDKPFWLLSRNLLKLIWSIPENMNLKYHSSEEILVYYENSWSPVYWLTVINEYLKGMFYRLEQCAFNVSKIKESIVDHMDEFTRDFINTLKTLTSIP